MERKLNKRLLFLAGLILLTTGCSSKNNNTTEILSLDLKANSKAEYVAFKKELTETASRIKRGRDEVAEINMPRQRDYGAARVPEGMGTRHSFNYDGFATGLIAGVARESGYSVIYRDGLGERMGASISRKYNKTIAVDIIRDVAGIMSWEVIIDERAKTVSVGLGL